MCSKFKIPKRIKTLKDAYSAIYILEDIVKYYKKKYWDFPEEWHDVNLNNLIKHKDKIDRFLHNRKYRICA